MYYRYFGLRENPFALPPDPRYLYLSLRHQEALAHLMYGITQGGGFVQLTGEVGTGKTMMIRAMLERLPDNIDVALVLYPYLSVHEFVAAICDDLRVRYPKNSDSLKGIIDALNNFLLENHAKGRRTVLIIDEAHKLSHDVLEQVRLLTNLETDKQKLLQILLIGQPELDKLLAQPNLRQLAQRVTARYNLKSLLLKETGEYVIHRLRVAGAQRSLFTEVALKWAYRFSGGIPRLINILCDRALLGAYAKGKSQVTLPMVRHAASEIGTSLPHHRLVRRLGYAVLAAAVIVFGGVLASQHFEVSTRSASNQKTMPAKSMTKVDKNKRSAEAVATVASIPHDVSKSGPTEGAVMPASGLAALLTDANVDTTTETAFSNLFSKWNKAYQDYSGKTGCERAQKAGLNCLFRQGTWNNLKQYNRPAIIELMDDENVRHHIVITKLSDEKVVLIIGTSEYELTLSEIGRFWYGKFLLLWEPPAINARKIRLGMRGSSVRWLRNAMSWYSGSQDPTGASDIFDDNLEDQVKEFQRQHQLDDDGVVGDLTLIQLNSYNPTQPPPMLLWTETKTGTG
jgi:general secretion pathway protein A